MFCALATLGCGERQRTWTTGMVSSNPLRGHRGLRARLTTHTVSLFLTFRFSQSSHAVTGTALTSSSLMSDLHQLWGQKAWAGELLSAVFQQHDLKSANHGKPVPSPGKTWHEG